MLKRSQAKTATDKKALYLTLGGQFQQGKSLIFDLLIGKVISPVGNGERTTTAITRHVLPCDNGSESGWIAVDTPGVNHDVGDDLAAMDAYQKSDLLLWVTKDQQLSGPDLNLLQRLQQQGINVGIILNVDSRSREQSERLSSSIWAQAKNRFSPIPLSLKGVLIVQPQLMSPRGVAKWNRLPRYFREVGKHSRQKYSDAEAERHCGIEQLRSLFAPIHTPENHLSIILMQWITFRNSVRNWHCELVKKFPD